MNVQNLEYDMISRFTQDNDYMDVEIDMLNSTGNVDAGQSFNVELIHNILLGITTLNNPNYSVKYLDSSNNEYETSSVESDFYETEDALISETIFTNSVTLTDTIYLIQGEILYNRGGAQDPLSVIKSTQLQSSSQFSENTDVAASNLKGLKVDLAGGDLSIKTIFRFLISK